MAPEDLFKMLDLDASPAPAGSDGLQIESTTVTRKNVQRDPAALVLDLWNHRQGRQIRDRLAQDLIGEHPRPIHRMSTIDLADLHQGIFDPSPELVDADVCEDAQKHKYFRELFDTPEFHELRRSTVLDDAATELAIERLAEGLDTLRKNDPDDKDKDGFGPGRAAGNATRQAIQDVQDLDDAREGLGIGPGSGGQYDVKQAIDLYKKMRGDPNLQKIINLAGRYRLFGQSQQRRKVTHGMDDMTNVTIGNDLPRMTQSEFLSLGIPELEDDVCRRLLDSQAMVYEWHAQEPVAKGPVIVLLDESGSMTHPGDDGFSRIQHAKAISLAFCYLARQQNRWCALVAWSGVGQRRSIVLAPGQWDQESLMVWLASFFSGGTVPPVSDLPEIYDSIGAPQGSTDICYVTDGTVSIDPSEIEGFNIWKKEVNAKVITLVVSASAGDMTKISDETYCVESLGINEATGRILSI